MFSENEGRLLKKSFWFEKYFKIVYFNAGVTLSRIWKQMATRIWNFEFRAKVAPNLIKKQSIAYANTMPTEGHATVAEPYTMATEKCNFSSSSWPESHTMATRRRIESTMRSN